MQEIIQETIGEKTRPAEAEIEVKADKLPDKFKDVSALLNAYNSLEAEFTKRCQRIKELERGALSDKSRLPEGGEGELLSVKKEEDILKDYLKGILKSRQTAIVLDDAGVGVKTPADKPKTIAEAGALAKEIL